MTVHDAWSFAQLEDFWRCYEPLTPWGRDEVGRRAVFNDAATINHRHDDIAAAIGWLEAAAQDVVGLDRVSYHLKRLPRLPLVPKDEYEQLELFQFKKFLANYRGLLQRLPAAVAAGFGLVPAGRELATALDMGGSDAETFFLADAYHPDLAALRSDLRGLDDELLASLEHQTGLVEREFGLVFAGREFLVADRQLLPDPLSLAAHCSVEPYDDAAYLVRLLPNAARLALATRRESLLAAEQATENEVLRRLSGLVVDALPALCSAVQAVTRFDLARAGAVLAGRFALVRPDFDAATAVRVRDGRFLPCQLECQRLGLAYQPLSTEFGAPAVGLFGSNMGGKTVVLKSLLFFQLLAQAGLYVPAAAFQTRVFDHIEYVGELAGERLAGLSGFGFEIWRFQRVWPLRNALIAFDELARTTGSHEAEALLSAIVEAYARPLPASPRLANPRPAMPTDLVAKLPADRTLALFTTHFRGVARLPAALYLRMEGLDHQAACLSDDGGRLEERLAGINRHMRYRLVADQPERSDSSDALAIAAMLGLDCALVERAQAYFQSQP